MDTLSFSLQMCIKINDQTLFNIFKRIFCICDCSNKYLNAKSAIRVLDKDGPHEHTPLCLVGKYEHLVCYMCNDMMKLPVHILYPLCRPGRVVQTISLHALNPLGEFSSDKSKEDQLCYLTSILFITHSDLRLESWQT